MKNKLFYILFVVYTVMVVLILYINGVFTGEVASFDNLMINGVFLVIIGVLFLFSAASFIRLNRLTDDLQRVAYAWQNEYKEAGGKNIWNSLMDRKGVFEESNLQLAFGKYRMRIKSSKKGKQYAANCDIEEYINEHLLERVGSNYFNSAISGTMTGLGILGTFIGLSLGLGSFNGDDIYTISDNVGPLLSGMKVAFHTSVYGILFSLVFNFVYRSIMSDAYEKLDFFLNVFRQCACPPSPGAGDENTAAMLVYQANMASYMKQLLEFAKGEAAGQTKAIERMADQFLQRLQEVMGAELEELGDAVKSAAYAQTVSAKSGKSLLDAAGAVTESGRQLQEAMERMLKRQEQLSGELAQQGRTLQETCEELSRDVSSQLYTFEQMRSAYEEE